MFHLLGVAAGWRIQVWSATTFPLIKITGFSNSFNSASDSVKELKLFLGVRLCVNSSISANQAVNGF